MKKSKTKVEIVQDDKAAAKQGISATGKKIIFMGAVFLIAGFLVLTRTDPRGENWASILSPFLIIGGYIVIAVGIILPDR